MNLTFAKCRRNGALWRVKVSCSALFGARNLPIAFFNVWFRPSTAARREEQASHAASLEQAVVSSCSARPQMCCGRRCRARISHLPESWEFLIGLRPQATLSTL